MPGEAEVDALGVTLGVTPEVGLAVADGEGDVELLPPVIVPTTSWITPPPALPPLDAEGLADGDDDVQAVGDGETLGEGEALTDGEGDGDADGLGLTQSTGEGELLAAAAEPPPSTGIDGSAPAGPASDAVIATTAATAGAESRPKSTRDRDGFI